jgi:hypothetical protein
MSNQKSSKKGFERKLKKNGAPNPLYADVLEVDKPLAGQAYGCFSFISPEKILKQREMFFFEEFVKQWEINKSMEKFHGFLNFISYKYKLHFNEIMNDFEGFVKEEKENIIKSQMEDDYKNFLDREEESLQKQFDIKHEFQTSTRGFKARGNFATQEEARLRAKMLREVDPMFDIFVCPVGTWVPPDPEPYKTGEVEYLEEELNQLAHEKKKNEEIAKSAFEKRKTETKQQAIEENKRNAQKFGNVITQDIDEDGNLIGVGITSTERTFEQKDPQDISVADIRSELFEGDNVIVGKSDYGQSQLLSGPFVKK